MKYKMKAIVFAIIIMLSFCNTLSAAAVFDFDEPQQPSLSQDETLPASSQEPVSSAEEPTLPLQSEEPTYSQSEVITPTQPQIEPTQQETEYQEPTVQDEPQSSGGWLNFFIQPTSPTQPENETIPKESENITPTTLYVIIGIALWVVIGIGSLVTLGILGATFKRKHSQH